MSFAAMHKVGRACCVRMQYVAWQIGSSRHEPRPPCARFHCAHASRAGQRGRAKHGVRVAVCARTAAGGRTGAERVPAWEYPRAQERPKFAQLIIPTLDSVRYEHLLGLVFAAGGRVCT